MKFKLPKRRVWRVAIYLLSLLLVLVAIDLILIQLGRRIPISYETTRITAPTIPGGPIDYLAALESHYSEGVTSENNAVPLLLQAFGRDALAKNQPRDGITTRLGMPPLPDAGDYLVHRDKFPEAPTTQAYNGANEGDVLPYRPWKTNERPQVAAWIKANEKPLAKVIEASTKARFFYPFDAGYRPETLMEVQLPYLIMVRESARALTVRALLRANDGDLNGAKDDLAASHRIARLLMGATTMIDRLVGYALDSDASRAEQNIAAAGLLNAAEAREWQKSSRELPPLSGFADAFDRAERYMFLDCMQYGARNGAAKLFRLMDQTNSNLGPNQLWSFMPVRFAHAMAVGNGWYDRLVAASAKPGRAERNKGLQLMDEFINYSRGEGTFVRMIASSDWPIAMFFPGLTAIASRYDAADAQRAMADVAFALAAYRAEKGGLPDALDALKPQHMAEIPLDPFSSKPFVYRPSKEGYVLYSVGPDLTDDGGKPTGTGTKGDLVAGLP